MTTEKNKVDKQGQIALAVFFTIISFAAYLLLIGMVISSSVERHQQHPRFYQGVPPNALEAADWIFIVATGLVFAVTTITSFKNAAKN